MGPIQPLVGPLGSAASCERLDGGDAQFDMQRRLQGFEEEWQVIQVDQTNLDVVLKALSSLQFNSRSGNSDSS